VFVDLEQGSSEVLDARIDYRETLAQYDEMNPFFFAEVVSFVEPSFIHQEL